LSERDQDGRVFGLRFTVVGDDKTGFIVTFWLDGSSLPVNYSYRTSGEAFAAGRGILSRMIAAVEGHIRHLNMNFDMSGT
jgi:hypothetical protein